MVSLTSTCYWGNGRDFDVRRMSYLPSDSSQSVAAADFDNDGQIDLAMAMANYSNGTWTEMDSFVYFGSRGGSAGGDGAFARGTYPLSNCVNLPTSSAQGVAAADLNRDGFADIVIAQSAGHWEYRRNRDEEQLSPSRIFWGAESGFSRDSHVDCLRWERWTSRPAISMETAGRKSSLPTRRIRGKAACPLLSTGGRPAASLRNSERSY